MEIQIDALCILISGKFKFKHLKTITHQTLEFVKWTFKDFDIHSLLFINFALTIYMSKGEDFSHFSHFLIPLTFRYNL